MTYFYYLTIRKDFTTRYETAREINYKTFELLSNEKREYNLKCTRKYLYYIFL